MSEHAKESGENVSDIQHLTARAHDLSTSIAHWNSAYMVLVALTVVLAAGVFIAQFVANKKSMLLAGVQEEIIEEKDRIATADSKQKDGKIADAMSQAGDSNKAAGKAEARAAEANTKAEGFRLDIAKANESASKAQAQVASASAEAARANLELAKLKTPRNLNLEQQERVSAAISQFTGTPYDLWVSTDSDSAALMEEIDAVLRAAKWEFHASGTIQFAGKAGIISNSGVEIHFPQEMSDRLAQPALALAAALKAEGIPQETVYSDGLDFNKEFDRARIHVWIGSKPPN